MDTAAQPRDIWDAGRYLRYADARLRPFIDLLARIDPATPPELVVDLGCGPGNATALLAMHWPGAHVLGVDSSPTMIEAARGRARPGRLDFREADLRAWTPEHPVDVLTANAVLQWLPGHLDLLGRLAGLLAPGGVLGMQVPANFTSPTHRILDELRTSPTWRDRLGDIAARPGSHEPVDYLAALSDAGLAADVWETTYLHVLDGPDGVVEFVRGTALRPVETHLDPGDVPRFIAEYSTLIREAYPPRTLGGRTVQVLPYRRVFAVGHAEG